MELEPRVTPASWLTRSVTALRAKPRPPPLPKCTAKGWKALEGKGRLSKSHHFILSAALGNVIVSIGQKGKLRPRGIEWLI